MKSLNSIIWDKSPGNNKKKRIHKTMAQSVVIHGAEAWDVSRKNRNKLLVAKMDCLRRIWRRTRLDRIRNETTREMMETEKDTTEEVQKR
jgi:hypothetical protein